MHNAKSSPTEHPVLFMAGGTGGHVFPALACATALQKQGIPVHWLGTRNGLESYVIPNSKIPISYLPVSGLRGKHIFSWLSAPFKLVWSLAKAMYVMRQLRPRVVIGMGGFVSGPGGLAAWLLRIPLLIHEQNAIPGTTNRLLSRLATEVLEGFPNTFSAKVNAVCTGNPLRYDLLEINLPLPRPIHEPLRVLVLGGSQGAQILNETLPAATAYLHRPVLIWHQVGRQKFSGPPPIDGERVKEYRVDAFIDQMALAYTWADVVICRSGALTVSEIAHAALPSILIPFPFAIDDHQTANARVLSEVGAAVLLPQTELSPATLAQLLNNLELPHLQQMSIAAKAVSRPAAAEQVIRRCLERAGS